MLACAQTGNHLCEWQHSVDSNQPSFRSVGLLEEVQIEESLANNSLSDTVVARVLAVSGVHFSEPEVAKSVHQTVEHSLGRLVVDSVVAIVVEIVFLNL